MRERDWRRCEGRGLLDDLDAEDRRGDVELDIREQLLERLKGLVLVLDQGILLSEGAEADPFA